MATAESSKGKGERRGAITGSRVKRTLRLIGATQVGKGAKIAARKTWGVITYTASYALHGALLLLASVVGFFSGLRHA